ncbi:glutamate--tRNA ligase [Methylonatrum kenyense]|uniref:glutamate--tRNA ligase n=1 Tax=Methylonatrum kenyense TaxID=455253 RepID=UPI0020BDADBD|nr:glutamate--tRNA ligase [Methylonatrum kenyense]MCK8515657.1 glutamate--tRNA ligase [Methylonatrum kenyense]
MTLKTRFAPSPTGYLHIGGARTALFSWLYARRHGGSFVLRIEDTDLERSTPESVNAILEGMAWLGLDYDEGPFYQTRRFDRYREVLDQLLAEGKAYRCFCSRERLDKLREEQQARKEKPRYDGCCRDRTEAPSPDAPFVVRFRNPQDGQVVVNDRVRGRVVFSNAELDDLIIARTDGSPTYNFTVVVDDMDMEITHVVRGDDHLNNTPRQINILQALGVEPPIYAHVPMILGEDGKRLSKRHGAVGVMSYRDQGYLPEAMLNYLVRLGWSHGDQEVFSLDELVQLFDIEDINTSASSLNISKLDWLNQHYMKTAEPAHVARHLSWHIGQLGIDPAAHGPALDDVVVAQRERARNLADMAAASRFFYSEPEGYDEKAARKNLKTETRPTLLALREALEAVSDWNADVLHAAVIGVSEALELKLGKVAQPLRVALAGVPVSPPIDVTLELLGRDTVLARIDRAVRWIDANTEIEKA